MTDYFVDTATGLSGNNGLSWATAKNSIVTAISALPSGDHTVYCRGGIDAITASFNSDLGSFTSLTIIGELDTYNFGAYSKYRWRFGDTPSGFSMWSRVVTLRQLYIDCTSVCADALSSNASLLYIAGGPGNVFTVDRCFVHIPLSATNASANYPHPIRIRPATGGKVVVTNTYAVMSGKINSGNAHAICIQNNGSGAGLCGDIRVSGCYAETGKLTGNTTSVPFGGFSGEGNPSNSTIHDCIARGGTGYGYRYVGEGSANIGTNGHGNAGAGFSSTAVSNANIDALFVNPSAFDYTPVNQATGPVYVDGVGYDSSALTSISHDFRGVTRVVPWDIGPHAYLMLSPYPDVHTVTDISQAADPECIYYGQTVGGRTVQVGDQVSFDTATQTNAWPVDIDSQGFPIVDSGGAYGTDSFKFNMSAGTSGVWEPEPPAYATWLFTIAAADPDITTTALWAMTDQQAFSQTLAATGTAPMTWDVLAGSLPPGLSLSSAGVLSGTVAGYGAYDFTARVTNAVSTDSQQYTGTVAAALPVVLTTSLPAAYDTGAAYSHQLIASGSSPITWTLTGGALPAGITLSTNGLLSGGTTVEPATFSPQFTATNPAGSNVKTLTLQVLEGTPPVSGPGNALGGIPLSLTGQWLITANPIDHYYLGHPVSATGALVTSAAEAVARWHNGLPHIDSGAVAIDDLAIVSSWISGLPLTAAGKVAVAMASVAYWAGGVPFTSTGRVAVSAA